MHHFDTRVSGGSSVGNLRCFVGRGIVNNDELVRFNFAVGNEHIAEFATSRESTFEIFLFVPHGEEDGKFIEMRSVHSGV